MLNPYYSSVEPMLHPSCHNAHVVAMLGLRLNMSEAAQPINTLARTLKSTRFQSKTAYPRAKACDCF